MKFVRPKPFVEFPEMPDEMSDYELEIAEECADSLRTADFSKRGLIIWQFARDYHVNKSKLARHLQWRATCRKLRKGG